TFSQAQSSVFGVIQARPDLQKFEEGLISTGLNTTFANKDGVYTIFAPTNDAFSMIPGAILNNQAALKDLILTHCVFGFYRTSDLVDGRDLSTMNLRNLGVNFVGNRIFINGAEMIVRNIQGNNGMVHIIDTVIPKSSTTETTVMSVIRNSTEHIFLSQMVENVEMDDYLATENNITFFAPNDDAFLRLSDEKFQRFFGNDTRYIIDVINFHIVEKIIEFEELTHNAMFTALNGQKLTITIDVPNTITFINNVKIQFAGIRAVNGIVYTIEKIMVPEPLPEITIEDYVRESEFHTTLEIAIDESGLSPILSADGDWTFFAPTDEAFEKMDEATLDLLLNNFPGLLRDLMDNHLVEGRFFLEELKALEVVNAVNGFELIIKEEADGDYINKSKFLINNIEVDNGIVHVLDAVLQTSDSLVTVHDIVTTTDAISTFGEYVRESPLDSLLQTDGPFTVFAPNNTAFSNLPDAFIEILENDTMNLLNSFLENHVINGNFPSSNLTHNLTLTTRFGEEVVITVEPDGRVFVNQGLIIIDNLIADNGVVHVIDAVIDLEEPPLTIYGYVAGSQDLNILESLITNSNLRQLYDSTENLTLFAPTDNAFENLPDDYLNDTDISFIIDLLFRHTLSAETLLSEIITKDWLISSGLDSLRVTIENNEFFIRDAKIIISDIVLANGIVHVVDAVITDNEFIPEPVFTVYDIISESENHTVFKGYIDSASLDAKLREDTTITVFAPTNEAFGILPLGLINALEADPDGLLRETLLYHINKDSLSSNELTDDLVLLMEDGNEAFIDVTTDGIFINDAKLVFENFAASNGVVHFIDAVITPIEPTKTVFDFIAQSSIHKTLESAVIAAELDDDLAEQNPITMFAPTDEAFDALPSIVLDALLNNPQGDLLNLLLIHKNDNLIRRADLTDGVELNMTNGEIVKVSVQSDTIYVNNAKVIMEEVIADNGIVHVIDAIILKREERNTIYDFIAESEDHTILKDAIDSSGLDQELIDGVGITYFAPTNDAFNALPADVLNDLLADPNGALLDLLKFHKYNAELFSTDITNELVITMDNGVEVTFTVSSDGIFINNAKLGVTDIEVDNGIVHEIDAIIEEVVERVTVYDFLVNSPDHTLLKEAIDSAGLAVNLMEEESIT
ncbi:MAG: fasciclin domain-containing protein, partial [Saprospiraceae bacterium]|nr:fasciclin domain-containing protein [Saprospiraceae bacterium]